MLLLLLPLCVAPAQAQTPGEYVPGEIIVGYRVEATAEQKAAIEAAYRLTLLVNFSHIRARHYRLPPGLTVEDTVHSLQSLPVVEYAEPNYVHRLQTLPTDPRFPEQWYLRNTGQTVNGSQGPPGEDINWAPAINLFSGTRAVIVAVVDSGVALDHPEFTNRFWINARETLDGVDDDANGYTDDVIGWDFYNRRSSPLDENGHGTLVASLIAAAPDNGEGGVGVSPTARVMALRVAPGPASAEGISTTNIISAFIYAGLRGARIINASIGGDPYSASAHATVQWLNDKGVLLVASAGNGGGDQLGDNDDVTPNYPASYPVPNVISVAATDRFGELARFSNYGAASVHIAAPGVDMFGAGVRRTTTFAEEFSTGAPGWTTGVTPLSLYNVPWSTFTDAIGRHWAVDSIGTYLPYVDSWLMSPPITTGFSTQITGRCILALNWGDCFWFELSTDNGATWNLPPGSAPACEPIDFWDTERTFDLSQYDFQTIRIRFRFRSDGFYESDGVYLGRVSITNVQAFAYDGTQYRHDSGTSFAAPLVSGAAALVWSQRPDLTVSQVRQIILGSARGAPSLVGKVSSGGKLDVLAALQAAIAAPSGLTLSADAIDFRGQAVGFRSSARTVALRNAGEAPVNMTAMTPSNLGVFSGSHDCPASLPAGGTCTLSLHFAPNALGEADGVVTIRSDAPGSPHVVNVVGVGVSPDTVPGPFAFEPALGVLPLSSVVSGAVTVSGINAPAPISISGGEYSVNGGAFASASGSVNAGDLVRVRVAASASVGATISATLTIGGVSATYSVTTTSNRAPTANAQTVTTAEDTPIGITLTGSDPDGDLLTFVIVRRPAHGTLTGTGADRTYTPRRNFNGRDRLTFTVSDGYATSAPATVVIEVTPANDSPFFHPIADRTVRENTSRGTVFLTGVSPGPRGERRQTVTMSATSGNPEVIPHPTISGTGATRRLVFRPVSRTTGTATITVTADDGQPAHNTLQRTFTITVTPVADVTVPVFSGLSSATALSPSQIALTWSPASDNATNPGEIVYEICRSQTSGQCVASFVATHTTRGVTSRAIGSLAPGRTYFFVVRARDLAGNRDANTVERSATTRR